jgi:hypothetical protein
VAAQWAGGVIIVEPALQAEAVEEVAAGEHVHHGLRLEAAQAHPTVHVGVAPPEPRRPLWNGSVRPRPRSDCRELVLLALLPRVRHRKAQKHPRRW